MGARVRPVLLLTCAVVFADTIFYAAITPLLPSYVADLDLTKGEAGVLVAAYPAGTFLAALPSGWLAGRVGARAATLLGMGLLSAASVAFAVGDSLAVLVTARFVQGIGGAASWAGALGWLMEATPAERRGQTIGVAMSLAIAGALCGPVLGAGAEALGTGPVFGAVAVMAALLMAAALRMEAPPPAGADLGALARALRDPRMVTPMWLVMLPGLLFGTLGVLGPLRLDALGAGTAAIAAVYVVAGALEAVVNPIVGRISDRRGRRGPALVGVALTTALIGLVGLPERWWALAGLIVTVTPAIGILWTPAIAMLSDGAARHGIAQGLALSLMNLAWAVGQTAGSAGGGRLAQATGDAVPFLALAAIGAITLVLLARSRSAFSAV